MCNVFMVFATEEIAVVHAIKNMFFVYQSHEF